MKRRPAFACLSTILIVLANIFTISAAPVIRTASGANGAAIQAAVDQFRADLGGVNNGVGSSFTSGRREINWDGVPDSLSSPNDLPANFFNVDSPRGVVFDTTYGELIRVSADSSNPTSTPVRFGDINAGYPAMFSTFSAQRLFAAVSLGIPQDPYPPLIDVMFFIPGTKTPATVSGFGVVFSDLDEVGHAAIVCYGTDGVQISGGTAFPPVANNGLSFAGISFNAGERISRVRVVSGSRVLASNNVDVQFSNDMVVMDDFIYGEPRAATFHTGDFDGDGVTDSTVYRPGSGTWFTLNSGSSTVTQENFGLNGDIPVDGDFDGDSRADLAIYRPSTGVWFFKRSSNGTTLGAQFGQAGDKPVVGDYDKDGLSDIAVWRPGNGNYFVLRSSSNFSTFFSYPFGQSGDIPVQGGAQ